MRPSKILIIGLVWPEPSTTAAGHRMLQLIWFFLEEGCGLTFASTATPTKYSLDLQGLGVNSVPIRLNHSSFDAFISDLQPDVVVFDRFITEEYFGWRVSELLPNAVRILDSEDLHSLRNARKECLTSGVHFSENHWLQNEMTKREIASIYRCDCTLVISHFELLLLQETIGISPKILLYFPFLVGKVTQTDRTSWPGFEERSGFVCIGSGKHGPNIDGIHWLKRDIWPSIRQLLPEAEIRIYGAYLPTQILQMHLPREGFHVLGWIEDLKTAMRSAKVNLAPLRFGAGLKGKLLDAMSNGTPSVTTDIGAEGMHQNWAWCGFVANNPQRFAEKAVLLHEQKPLWQNAQNTGMDILEHCFEKEMHHATLANKIMEMQEDLTKHRNQNFIGSLLQYHTLAATKYLSRWIELKERSKNLD